MFSDCNWMNSNDSSFWNDNELYFNNYIEDDLDFEFEFGNEKTNNFDETVQTSSTTQITQIKRIEQISQLEQNDTPNIQNIKHINKNTKLKSGKYKEAYKLSIYRHFREDYTNCAIFKILGCPKQSLIKKIGREYNIYYKSLIQLKVLPKFLRDYSRLMSLSVWFLQDNINFVIPFLKNNGYI